jgi:hypothetical protein
MTKQERLKIAYNKLSKLWAGKVHPIVINLALGRENAVKTWLKKQSKEKRGKENANAV